MLEIFFEPPIFWFGLGIFVWPPLLVWFKLRIFVWPHVLYLRGFLFAPPLKFGWGWRFLFDDPSSILWIGQNSLFSEGVNRKSPSQNASFWSVRILHLHGLCQPKFPETKFFIFKGVKQKSPSQHSSFSREVNQKFLCESARLENSKW